MRKSSVGGRTSFSGAPLRIRSDNVPSKSRPSSTFENRLSFGGSLAYGGTKLPMLNQRKSSQISFVPKSSRASSGIGVRGRTDIPKDPRPVSDKRYQTQCIKQLMEFLMVYNYPHPVSQKLLVSPSSKDFFRIFEFIYGRFVRGYKQGQKMEEEVPRILKMLGYPYALSKSSLFSVGSPHTWPYLLVALTWMIDLLRMTESISKEYNGIDAFIFETTDDDFDGVSEEKIVFDYCEKTYKAFLQGVDTFDEYDQAVEQALMQKHQGGNISNLLAENTRLEAEVELLEQAEERKKQLKEAVSMSQHDAKVIRTYMENLQQYKRVQEGELQKRVEDFEMMKSDLQSGRERLAHMQNIYEKQDLTPADVERLRAEQEALKQHVDHLEKQIASIDTDTWTITMEQAKLNEKVETEIAAYNRQAIALKLVPETAELANGRDFRLRSGFNSDIVSDFENNVKPMLTLMKKRCTSELRRKNKEKFQMALEMEQFQETVNEQKEKLVQMGKELANKEAEIESMKQMFHSGKKTEEIEALQQELSQLDPLCKQADAEAARAVKEYGTASSALSVKKVDVKRHLSEMEENLLQVKGFTTEVLDGLQNQLHGYVSKVDAADADISRRIAQLQLKSKQRKERLASMMKK